MPFDIEIAAFLVNSSLRHYDLPRLFERYFDIPPEDAAALPLPSKAILMSQLKDILLKELKDNNVYKLFEEVEMPLTKVLYKMEDAGIKIDTKILAELSKKYNIELEKLEKEIYAMAGEEFNIGSPKQLQEILFTKLGLTQEKKNKTGFSTDAKVLASLANAHPIADKLLQYRQYAKLISTYLDALPKLVSPKTGRIHTEFNQIKAATGRLSSINPNVQNIPIRTEEGRDIRKAFIAQEGYVLLSADYSQIELRLLAHFSQDPSLMKAFTTDGDIHAYTASLIFHKNQSEVTSQERRMAKTVNFGVIYGMGPFRLAGDLKITRNEAKEFIDKYFETYGHVKAFMSGLEEEAMKEGFLTTVLGRRRYFAEINSKNRVVQEAAKREAINYPLQGSAADIIKVAMINIDQELTKRKLKSRQLLQVHDELLIEVKREECEEVTHMVKHEMENAVKLNVPVRVDVGVGKNWLEAH